MKKKKVLFLCTGNSCRSQMAEGWARHYHNEWLEAFSAGIEKHGMNKYAILVMKEIGINISNQHSKLLSNYIDINFDLVVTVCSNAQEQCPLFPGNAKVIHVPFDDPPTLSKELTTEHEILEIYRKVRDKIGTFVKDIERLLEKESN